MDVRRRRKELGIVELAVDPADVDRETYPVRIRLTRPLTRHEAEGLAVAEPDLQADGDAIVVPDAKLDDIARAHGAWTARLERIQTMADELEGESWLAEHRLVDRRVKQGGHLHGEHSDDRGLH